MNAFGNQGRTKQQELASLREDIRRDELAFHEAVLKVKSKDSKTVNFRLNVPQWKIERIYQECQRRQIQMFWANLKYRQPGASVYYNGKTFVRTISRENHVAHISAHRNDRAKKLFRLQRQFYNQLPQAIRPEIDTNSTTELYFKDINSTVGCSSAGDAEGPRGDTLHTWIISEAAYISKNGGSLSELLEAGLPAIPEHFWDIMLVLETTANGTADEFYSYWLKAEKGEGGWIAIFLYWQDDPYYETPLHKHPEDEIFRTSPAKYDCREPGIEWGKLRNIRDNCRECQKLRQEFNKTFMTDKLRDRMKRFGLTWEQMHWYWLTLNKKFGGNQLKMQQEYPCDAKEAFIASGTPVFDSEVLNQLKGYAQERPFKTYEVPMDAVDFDDLVENDQLKHGQHSYLKIYQPPKPGRRYVIASDSSEGKEKSNPSATVVKELETMNTVAVMHGRIEPEPLADYLMRLGRIYGQGQDGDGAALVAVERQNSGVAVLSKLAENYENNYQKHRQTPEGWEETTTLGWDTNVQTKPWIVALARKVLSAYADDMVRLAAMMPCMEVIDQYLTFTHAHLQLKAAHGAEDDFVMADMICLGVCHQELGMLLADPLEKRTSKKEEDEEAKKKASRNVEFDDHMRQREKFLAGEEFKDWDESA